MKQITHFKDIEFFCYPADTTCTIYARQYGYMHRFCDLPENIINIAFSRLLDFSDMLKHCAVSGMDRRQIVERFILLHWANLDEVMDVDSDGKFHFETVDIESIAILIRESCNQALQDIIEQEDTLAQRRLQIEKVINFIKDIPAIPSKSPDNAYNIPIPTP